MSSKRYIWWWVLPAALLFLIIILLPFITALTYSFRAFSFTDSTATGQFIGIENYRKLVFDQDFYNSFKVTFLYMVPSILIQGALGLGIALLISRAVQRARILIPIMLLPTLLTPVVIGLVGVLTLNPDFGVIGIWLNRSGLIKEAVLGSYKWALPAIIAVDTYQWTPFVAVILTAGLLGLPKEPYEAAQVDGANPVQTFFRVTMPLLWPYFVVAMLIRVIDAFRIFDIIWVMTRGGPGTVTEAVAVYAYRHTFRYWDMGYGSALIMVLFVFISIMVEYLYKALQKWQGAGGSSA
ncbi:MAG: sugar ABC transporter permease [Anaerolineae bacterium]|nr:sugar ABC transporter permease [Anaerolineae bacterium]